MEASMVLGTYDYTDWIYYNCLLDSSRKLRWNHKYNLRDHTSINMNSVMMKILKSAYFPRLYLLHKINKSNKSLRGYQLADTQMHSDGIRPATPCGIRYLTAPLGVQIAPVLHEALDLAPCYWILASNILSKASPTSNGVDDSLPRLVDPAGEGG